MPQVLVAKVAKVTGKSEEEVERIWGRAKELAGAKQKEGTSRFWALTVGIFKKMTGYQPKTTEAQLTAAAPDGEWLFLPVAGALFGCGMEDPVLYEDWRYATASGTEVVAAVRKGDLEAAYGPLEEIQHDLGLRVNGVMDEAFVGWAILVGEKLNEELLNRRIETIRLVE